MKATSVLIITLLSLFVVSGLFAQDKYEYAVVYYGFYNVPSKGKVVVSKANSYEEIDVKIDKGNVYTNFSELIKQVEKMGEDGWEVFGVSTLSNSVSTSYHLRKKKN